MAEDLLAINPFGIAVDEGANRDDDDLSSAGLADLMAEVAAAPDGSFFDYLDNTYLSGGEAWGGAAASL